MLRPMVLLMYLFSFICLHFCVNDVIEKKTLNGSPYLGPKIFKVYLEPCSKLIKLFFGKKLTVSSSLLFLQKYLNSCLTGI